MVWENGIEIRIISYTPGKNTRVGCCALLPGGDQLSPWCMGIWASLLISMKKGIGLGDMPALSALNSRGSSGKAATLPPFIQPGEHAEVKMQAVLFGFYTDGSWGGAEAQLASRTSRIQGMNLVTRAYTPGKNGLHRLLPQDTMPARVQAPSFWQTRGPPESPCRRRQDCVQARKKVPGPRCA